MTGSERVDIRFRNGPRVSRGIHVRIRACDFRPTANPRAPTLEFNFALPSPQAFILNIVSASPAAIQSEGASSLLITNLISIFFGFACYRRHSLGSATALSQIPRNPSR
jgi:hypothetical protein